MRSKGVAAGRRADLVAEAPGAVGLSKARTAYPWQLTTRADPRFVELRGHVHARIQKSTPLTK